jgi:hypothetical protein
VQCPNCGKTGRVTIAGKQYCTNCGSPLDGVAGSQPSKNLTDLSGAPTPPAAVPTAVPMPKPSPTATQPAPPPAKPAADFHAPAASVLDLRTVTPKATPTPIPVTPPTPEAPKTIGLSVETSDRVNTPASISSPSPAPPPAQVANSPQPTSVISPSRRQARLANAQAVTKSSAIQKFAKSKTPPAPEPVVPSSSINAPVVPLDLASDELVTASSATAAVPTVISPRPVVSTPTPSPSQVPPPAPPIQPLTANPVIAPTIRAQPVAPPPGPAVAGPQVPAISAVLPGTVATTIESHKKLITPQSIAQADPESARKQAFALALANAPKRQNLASVAAGVVAVIIMGGYIWLQNAPKLAIRTAAGKAGFEASLPNYLPNNYNLNKPIIASPGRIVLAFSSPGNGNISITQQKTDWDSKSLLDNYVSQQTDQYLVVNQQGLTIYLYNGNMASWVNRGVWYSVQGNNQLNRDQLLKIAYGL